MLDAVASFVLAFLAQVALGAVRSWQADRAQREAGRAEAVAEAERQARESAAAARQVEAEAAATHRADATDAAFDATFKRD